MGTFKARIGVSDGNGGSPVWVDADVDTGATYTVLPDKLLRERVGVLPAGRQTFVLADGSRRSLHIDGEEVLNRVVFGADNQYLLGATTLQAFELIADTTNHRLIPAPKPPA